MCASTWRWNDGGRAELSAVALHVRYTVLVAVAWVWPRGRTGGLVAASAPSVAETKKRVEEGDGVPFFHERFGCRSDDERWSSYRELVQYSRLRIFDQKEGPDLARWLADSLKERTQNATEILQCNLV